MYYYISNKLIMNQHANAMSFIHENGQTTKDIIIEEYNEYRRDYQYHIKRLTKQDISCRILLSQIKIYYCLYNNDYNGFIKYKNKYIELESSDIDNRLFNKSPDKAIPMFIEEYNKPTIKLLGESEQLRQLSINVKENLKELDKWALFIFGKK